jgi:hypothetical protein
MATPKVSRSKILETDQENEQEQETGQATDNSSSSDHSPTNVLEFLRKSNIINMDVSLKTLFESVESLQSDPANGWGIISDSGHLVLIWHGQEK